MGHLSGRKLSFAVWGVSMWAIMIFGWNQASAGGILGNPLFLQQFPQMNPNIGSNTSQKSTIIGTVVALYTLCGTLGALTCSFLGDVFGRRRTIFAAAVVSGVGAILMGSAFSFAQFIVARIVAGLGTGGIIATVSVWQSEVSRPAHRGSHVSGFGIFCGSGLALALWFEFGMSHASGSVSWRLPLAFPAILAVIVMSVIFLVPESPRWLIKKNRHAEARRILASIQSTHEDAESVQSEVKKIEASIKLAGSASLGSLFTMGNRRIFHRVILAISIQMFLQLSGINSVAYYAPSIFENQLHFNPTLSSILAAASITCLVLGSAVCSITVDRFGRRKLMLVSAASMSVCMACLAGLTADPSNKTALKAAIFFVFSYYFVYTLGFLGIPFLYASEVAPGHLRASVCGISTAASWLFNFLVVEVTPVAFNNIGYKYFIVYAVINAVCVPTVYLFYPETSGRTLEEIDQIFVASNSIFDTVSVGRALAANGYSDSTDSNSDHKHSVDIGDFAAQKEEALSSYRQM